jgi:hypothetical protein
MATTRELAFVFNVLYSLLRSCKLACCCPQAYVLVHHIEERCPKILNHSIRVYPATELYAMGGKLTTRRRTANPRCHDQFLRMLDRAHLYKYILGVSTQENSGTSLRQSHDHVQASLQSSFCLRNSSKYNQAIGDSQRIDIEITLITNCFDLM